MKPHQPADPPPTLDTPPRARPVSKRKSRRLPRPRAETIITFRLDDASAEVLLDRATRLQVSPHALARQYLREELLAAEERQALRQAVSALRQDVGLVAGVLLTSAGKASDEQARQWVKSNFP
jgi:hypothetical protein